MKKVNIFRITIYSLIVFIPLLAMLNCSGWSTSDMEVSRCYIDFEILREFSNYCYTWFHLSAFVAFFPIILFYTVIVVTTEVLLFIAKVINKYNNRKSD
ncbi:hypothetical protein [Aliarcobacter cryaerophilus]|jgi:hypothetical protein|uniref:Lipoprotein n=5 Tax=Arcobacteraceae TaxID=2808963 RepID=A0AAU0P4N5_9BACT|nr:hypothetical protein [Aliarcobacter cryaerophilus]WNL13371.1 hypothetical protein RJG52_04750 [Arcobacter sp. AZ-2023]WPD02906.1 hypothetical protein QUR79_09135 [Arcobacter sp. DSM 115972]WPD09856.1 hypothetical protein QUR77_00505 [Arcobacter sp. DSM 115954]WPD11893.1 hypothetical protein QT384_10890 [Arcobacter sp. DSM 115960]AYJ78062.1 putative membrane protein [Aliarcobacter cryaerophilus D2610]